VQGVKSNPQKFLVVENPGKFSKICAKSMKIREKSLNILANPLRIRAKLAPNVV